MYKSRTDMLTDFDILLRLKLNDNIRNEVISLYAAYLESNENYDEALLQLESLMGKETEDEFKNRVKLQNAYLLINSKKDTENAKALFEEVLKNTSDESYLFEIASAELNNLSRTKSAFPQALTTNKTSEKLANYTLSKNYPNPFNPSTKISFTLPASEYITLKIYDIIGNEIAVLAKGIYNAGSHSFEFNGRDLPSGIYIYTFRTDKISVSRKMLLIK